VARSISEIYDALILEKNNQTQLNALQPNIDNAQNLLNDLTSPSKVARWRLDLWVVSVGTWIIEVLMDRFKAEVEEIAKNAVSGTEPWYKDQALKFQYGDSLVYLNNKFQYATLNTAAQIVKRAAVKDVGGQVIIKVAKLVGGVVTPLSTAELLAFDAYMKKIKFAGTATATVSRAADLLKIAYTVYYDPLVLKSDGSLISNPSIRPVDAAINNYITNLPFNGELILTKLTDTVQLAQGVVNPILTSAQAKYGALPYNTITVKYTADAGHMQIDPFFPLTTQITYLPNA
jgi:hypothetical protein